MPAWREGLRGRSSKVQLLAGVSASGSAVTLGEHWVGGGGRSGVYPRLRHTTGVSPRVQLPLLSFGLTYTTK